MQEHVRKLVQQLEGLLQKQDRVILAIDGTSAALKSTLAAYLARELKGTVIHCDDFFLPMNLRSEARYQEPGGNIHYERMKTEVMEPLVRSTQDKEQDYNTTHVSCASTVGEKDCTFSYMCYDCAKGTLGERRTVSDVPLRIVEGAYALHPYFGSYYDFSVFLTVEEQIQMGRIEKRNPNPRMFREKWIPLEQKYFEAFGIPDKADMILDTTHWK